ncbi:MAG: hypothetical protein M3133_04550 [Actinomycetota bacterium]|nr:hypothetical protein [Actinomycetota bacterium]
MPNFIRMLALSLIALVAAVGLGACTDDESAGPEEGATVEEVAESPEEEFAPDDDTEAFTAEPGRFVGQTVVVSGEIQQLMSGRVLTIGEESHLLVFMAKAPTFDLEPGQVAQVKGVVGVYRANTDLNAALQQAVGPNAFTRLAQEDLDEIDRAFENRNYILATDIDLLETDEANAIGNDDGLINGEDEE